MAGLDRLYELVPAAYRERDEQAGYPLRALLRVVTKQADIVDADVERLWNNFFIETCDRWAIPYIGDLVANNLLHDGSRFREPDTARELFPDLVGPDLRPPFAVRTRADVAKTIYYRRRKGTLPMLEELARDVSGWGAHAVEFFEQLVWSQNLNHLRLHSHGCPDLRSVETVDRLNGPFDACAHTVDVRRPRQHEGWHNIRSIGFFLWRLRSYPITLGVARQGALPWQYHFSPLGNDAPLFSRWRREGDDAGLVTELHVPQAIRPAAFFEDVRRYQALPAPKPDHTDFYGLFDVFPASTMQPFADASLAIVRDGVPVPPVSIRCMDLRTWVQPPAGIVGVDVRRGRIAFGTAMVPALAVDVFYHYGFSADLGGGPYSRRNWIANPALAALTLAVRENAVAPDFATLDLALSEWVSQGRPDTIITISDNRNYDLTAPIQLSNGWLVIQAQDGSRPLVQPNGGLIRVTGSSTRAELTLSGLLVEGGVQVEGDIRRLRVLHTTLVPGRRLTEEGPPASSTDASISADAGTAAERLNANLRVEIAFSIVGPIRLPAHATGLWLLDSIVDGLATTAIAATGSTINPGPPATIERSTILGRSFFRQLPLASESIFAGTVRVVRRQVGCVRFSFVPRGSLTPRRYRCQPDLEIATRIAAAEKASGVPLTPLQKNAIRIFVRAFLVPTFTARQYGAPGYAQLHLGSPAQISGGAANEAEMGVFCHLAQTLRTTNLRIRLDEYLPFGLEPGLIYVT
jgi:hypothetical protein